MPECLQEDRTRVTIRRRDEEHESSGPQSAAEKRTSRRRSSCNGDIMAIMIRSCAEDDIIATLMP
jgi:hypothetical protein